MKARYRLESFARTINDMDPRLPKGRGRCFDIGMCGGCGAACPVFVEGGCEEPQEIPPQEIVDEHGQEDAAEIMGLYQCFANRKPSATTTRQRAEEEPQATEEQDNG